MEKVLCRVCGKEIEDWGVLVAKGATPPKLCEPCRRQIREYRAKMIVKHEPIRVVEAKLGPRLVRNLRPEGKCENFAPQIYPQCFKYSIGGRGFGPWGGARFEKKYIIYTYIEPQPEAPVLVRLMRKQEAEGCLRWFYLVFEPPVSEEPPNLWLELWFTRVWKWTLKGFGRQFKRYYPINVPHETLLTGGSRANSGRFGNHWELILCEELPEEVVIEEEI